MNPEASKERPGSTALPRCGAYGLGFRVSPPLKEASPKSRGSFLGSP